MSEKTKKGFKMPVFYFFYLLTCQYIICLLHSLWSLFSSIEYKFKSVILLLPNKYLLNEGMNG